MRQTSPPIQSQRDVCRRSLWGEWIRHAAGFNVNVRLSDSRQNNDVCHVVFHSLMRVLVLKCFASRRKVRRLSRVVTRNLAFR
jgi:hypothetical protein